MKIKHDLRAYLAWINVCIIWGTTYLAIRIGVHDLPPFLFAGLRWIAAGALLLAYLRMKRFGMPDKKQILHNAVIGILLLGFGNGLVVIGEQTIPSGLASLIITTSPFWMFGMETAVSPRRHVSILTLAGLLLGLSGIALIFGSDLQYVMKKENLYGIISLIFAVITWAAGTVYSKKIKMNTHPLMNASVQMIIAGGLQTLLGLALGESGRLSLTTESSLAFLYLVFFGSLVGYTSFIYAIEHLPVSLVSTYAYINPIIALLLGWLVLGEQLSLSIAAASVVIILGVIAVKKGTQVNTAKTD